jgi:UDP-N-acetylglucosamine 4,6-dehydratase
MNNSENILSYFGRDQSLLQDDVQRYEVEVGAIIRHSRFLVLGGAGSIGQAVTKEIFKRNPKKLHVVDISENNLVELVRDVRSSFGYIDGDFRTFALDIGSWQYDAFIESDGEYDYVLNLSALKHVRSEKDPFTLMRMIEVNILNTLKSIEQSKKKGVKKYFCVSTDKAANPVNMMGGSKRIMEMFLMREGEYIDISTSRFANVAFSDGSLLHGFNQRIVKKQPIVAPSDVKRYFVVPQESGELCLLSSLLGRNRDIFFPKLSQGLHLISFAEIAQKHLRSKGFKPFLCENEEEARSLMKDLPQKGKWPCLFAPSNTTGEKDFEEFFTSNETVDLDRFQNLGIVKNSLLENWDKLDYFLHSISEMRNRGKWTKEEIVGLFHEMIPDFGHEEKGKYLDSKM